MGERASRQSNIELLRILAACGVIMLHYNSTANGGFAGVADGSINQFILVTLEAISICAVNLFVLITGYFMCRYNKRDLLKPVGLLVQVMLFALVSFAVVRFVNPANANIDTLFEFLFSGNWYVYVFVALYLISPFINLAWEKLDAYGRKLLVGISFGLFSVYPTLLDVLRYWSGRQLNGSSTIGIEGGQAGYTIVNFVLVYIIGAAIRDIDEGKMPSTGRLIIRYFMSVCLTVAWSYADGIRAGKNIYDTIAWNYNNPLIIAQAVLLLLLFLKMDIRNSKIINALAGTTFTVYILHLRLIGLLHIKAMAAGNTVLLILHIIGSILGIYFVCCVVHFVYLLIKRPVHIFVSDKWYKFRRFIV